MKLTQFRCLARLKMITLLFHCPNLTSLIDLRFSAVLNTTSLYILYSAIEPRFLKERLRLLFRFVVSRFNSQCYTYRPICLVQFSFSFLSLKLVFALLVVRAPFFIRLVLSVNRCIV
jgi:hypothetical protein